MRPIVTPWVSLLKYPQYLPAVTMIIYLHPQTPNNVKVNVVLLVNESGWYRVDGNLRNDWRFLAGNGIDIYLTASTEPQNVTLQFDIIELYTNIQNYGLGNVFNDGEKLDFETWLRHSGQWSDLDHISGDSVNTYYTSDFENIAATIESFAHNGYNDEENNEIPPYDYINITVLLNFTVTGDYNIWSDLTKQSAQNW